MVGAEILQEILQAMDSNGVCLGDHLRISGCASVGSANSDMVGFGAEVVEPLLDRYADSAASTPEPDQEIRLESSLVDVGCELKRISKQVVRGDKSLVHCCNSRAMLR